MLTTVAKGKFLNAKNIETNAINPAKHLLNEESSISFIKI